MKVYVASSWRNEKQQAVVKLLRSQGFEVYDFKNPKEGDKGFHWSEIDSNWKNWTPKEYKQALTHELAEKGFMRDMENLKNADAVLLVLPCGRSAHLELGYAVGAGKFAAILLDSGEPELMNKMVNYINDELPLIMKQLKIYAEKTL